MVPLTAVIFVEQHQFSMIYRLDSPKYLPLHAFDIELDEDQRVIRSPSDPLLGDQVDEGTGGDYLLLRLVGTQPLHHGCRRVVSDTRKTRHALARHLAHCPVQSSEGAVVCLPIALELRKGAASRLDGHDPLGIVDHAGDSDAPKAEVR